MNHDGVRNDLKYFYVYRRELQDISNFALPHLNTTTKMEKLTIHPSTTTSSPKVVVETTMDGVSSDTNKKTGQLQDNKPNNNASGDYKKSTKLQTLPTSKLYQMDKQQRQSKLVSSCSEGHNENYGDEIYAQDIFQYLHAVEEKYVVACDYFSYQPHINAKMRTILIDWLIEVQLKFKLKTETLYLTVNYIDRFLSIETVKKNQLQLTGVTALLLASKFEEIHPPDVKELAFITANAYSRHDIIKHEYQILSVLEFNLSVPTVQTFLSRFLYIAQVDQKTADLALYYAHHYLLDYNLISLRPSSIAMASLSLALRATHQEAWNRTLESCSGYTEESINAVSRRIYYACISSSSSQLTGLNRKFHYGRFPAFS